MLGIALGSLAIGCLLLVLLFGNYGFSTKVSWASTETATTRLA
jgi:hypothetical protein